MSNLQKMILYDFIEIIKFIKLFKYARFFGDIIDSFVTLRQEFIWCEV